MVEDEPPFDRALAVRVGSLGEIEAIVFHDLDPSCSKVADELSAGIRAARKSQKSRAVASWSQTADQPPLRSTWSAAGTVRALIHARITRRRPTWFEVQNVDEEVVAQRVGLVGENTSLGAVRVGAQHSKTANQHRHFRRGQVQHVRLVHQVLCAERR